MEQKNKRLQEQGQLHLERAAQHYLNRLYEIDRRIEDVHESIVRLDGQATRTTIRFNTIGGGKSNTPTDFTSILDRKEEKCEELKQLLQRRTVVFLEIDQTIDTISNATIRQVLKKAYLDLQDIPEVADALNISEKHAYRLRKQGFQQIILPPYVYTEYEKAQCLEEAKKAAEKKLTAIAEDSKLSPVEKIQHSAIVRKEYLTLVTDIKEFSDTAISANTA